MSVNALAYVHVMKKAEEYRAHATECRALAARGDDKAREQLLQMAATWDSLAKDREKQLARQERIRALEVPPDETPAASGDTATAT